MTGVHLPHNAVLLFRVPHLQNDPGCYGIYSTIAVDRQALVHSVFNSNFNHANTLAVSVFCFF
jgi:hypothetical protein